MNQTILPELPSKLLLTNHTKAGAKAHMGLISGELKPKRIMEALKATQGNVAALKGFKKDHKRILDPVAGPPLRPAEDGKVGPNNPLSDLMTWLHKPVREGMCKVTPTEILSTEVALHLIKKFNSEVKDQIRKTAIGR